MNWYLFGLILYISMLIIISLLASRKIENASDFMVAGRKMPFWLLAFTFAGLWFGGGTVIGTTGTTLDLGIWSTTEAWGVIPDPYGAGLCLILAGLFYFGPIRRMGGVTLADYFTARFGRPSGLLSTIVMMLGWIFWVAAQVVVIGKVFVAVLGWPYELSIWIGMALVVIYTVAGGLWSVALTDFVQILLILIGIIVAVPLGLSAVGGWETVTETLPKDMISFFPTKAAGTGFGVRWLPWIAGWIIIGFGSIASPDITQVAQSGKGDRQVRNASISAGLVYWVFGSLLIVLGLVGATMLAEGIISGADIANDPELIMPVMVMKLFPLPVAVLFVAAILAAVMSSTDGALLALSTLFTKNILRDSFRASLPEKRVVLIGRIVVVVFAVVTTLIGINYPYVFLLMNFGFDTLLAGLFVPLTLGIYWKRANDAGFFAGVATGVFVRVILAGILEGWGFETVMYPANWYIYTVVAPIANLVAMVSVSLIFSRRSSGREPVPQEAAS